VNESGSSICVTARDAPSTPTPAKEIAIWPPPAHDLFAADECRAIVDVRLCVTELARLPKAQLVERSHRRRWKAAEDMLHRPAG